MNEKPYALGALPRNGAWYGLAPEASDGPDLLGFDDDVDSLADMITRRELTPPLTLGVLGEWGSGKSFFIRLLRQRIEALDRLAAESTEPRVIQIVFNAWQNAQANLWSALFYNVLQGVSSALARDTTDGWERLAAGLETGREVRKQLEDELRAARQRDEAIRSALERVNAHKNAIASNPVTTKELESIATTQAQVEFIARIFDTKDWSKIAQWEDRGPLLSRALVRSVTGTWALLLFLTLCLGLLANLHLVDWRALLPKDSPLWVAWLPFLGVGMTFYVRLLENSQLVTRLRRKIKEHQAAARVRDHEVATVEKEWRDVDAEASRSAHEVSELEQKLKSAGSSRSLTDYVQSQLDEAQATAYLGVLGKLRKEFETISRKLSEPPQPRRVVLYIDDLDRCPAPRVVETLEAIHLLFGFPAFVVVLAADARWLTRSLERQYQGQLADPLDLGAVPTTSNSKGSTATSFDYLEKVVQVPLWLPALDPERMKSFIRAHLAAASASQNGTQSGLEEVEVDALGELANLVGQNPRTAKRYLNTYRLIRGSLSEQALTRHLGEERRFRALALFLALAVGQPLLTRLVLEQLRAAGADLSVEQWLTVMDGRAAQDAAWQTHRNCIRGALEAYGFGRPVAETLPIAVVAKRYSFLQH